MFVLQKGKEHMIIRHFTRDGNMMNLDKVYIINKNSDPALQKLLEGKLIDEFGEETNRTRIVETAFLDILTTLGKIEDEHFTKFLVRSIFATAVKEIPQLLENPEYLKTEIYNLFASRGVQIAKLDETIKEVVEEYLVKEVV